MLKPLICRRLPPLQWIRSIKAKIFGSVSFAILSWIDSGGRESSCWFRYAVEHMLVCPK
jgi:hypothetical protein